MREMKDSGVAWIGEIPKDWNIQNISSLYTIRNEKVSDIDYQPLSVTMKGVVPQLSTAAKTNAHDDRKLVKKGDFAINSRSDRRGSCGIADQDGSVSLINTVLIPRKKMHPGYYNWLFHSSEFADEFYRWGHGIVDDLWTTSWQEMRNIAIPVPNFNNQEIIADYLGNKCIRLDTLISNQQKQIEKLKAYKQSIITDAVTKGMNKDVPMKDSGVDSIGIVPEHWKVKRVKYIADSILKGNGISKDEVLEDGDIQCIRYGEIYSKYDCSFYKSFSRTSTDIITMPQFISKGDILFAGTGELVEEIGKNIVYLGDDPCLAGGDIIILKHSQNLEFLNYALYGSCSQMQKSKGKAKLKVVHISASEIGNLLVALPPNEEQEQIAEYLNQKCNEINKLIEIKQQKIEKFEQYKKSLIYDYVTGKKEVIT